MAILSILPKQAVASGSFSRIARTFLRRKNISSSSVRSLGSLGSKLSEHKLIDDSHKVKYTSRSFSRSSGGIEKIRGGGDEVSVGKDEKKVEAISKKFKRVYVAVGANMGDRFGNLMAAISMLEKTSMKNINLTDSDGMKDRDRDESKDSEQLIRLVRTSFFRETAPMYVTDQDKFLNGAIEIETRLSPHVLLHRLKEVEGQIGRDLKNGLRWGPRPIDLDIIYYGVGIDSKCGGDIVDSERLTVPHPRIQERDFVLSPLCDLDEEVIHPSIKLSSREMLSNLVENIDTNTDETSTSDEAVRILPLPRGRILAFNETQVMGILNVTPDSFSDGGNYEGSIEIAVQQALQLVEDGASIIDIGGESTRPGAKEIEINIELSRTVPVIRKLREVSDVVISIDTRHAAVAGAAIEAGADIVNDVSGGTHDSNMLSTVGKLKVPMVIMHMRGTPETTQSMTQYDDVVVEVASALMKQSTAAEEAGIPRCLQILDPGIGFAKDLEQNLSLLKHSSVMRSLVEDIPLLLGPSRKGFIGKITGENAADQRDFGTLASCLSGLVDSDGNLTPTILRVHNVKGIVQGIRIMEAILKAE